MAIQVVPIIKALTPLIATAGSMYADWQRNRRVEPAAAGEQWREYGAQIQALEAASAENSHLIAQLGEQVRETALQLKAMSETMERRERRTRWLLAGGGAASFLFGLGTGLLLFV